jgi:hypothetical protein
LDQYSPTVVCATLATSPGIISVSPAETPVNPVKSLNLQMPRKTLKISSKTRVGGEKVPLEGQNGDLLGKN